MPRTLGTLLHPADRAEVLRSYVHRYTLEHVPAWAANPVQLKEAGREVTKYHAPQYRTDEDWLAMHTFAVRKSDRRLDGRATHAEPFHHADNVADRTWPLGLWLDAPYRKGQANG